MTTILLLGETGQVGYELQHILAPLGTLVMPGRARADFANVDALRSAILEAKPDIIVNAAGFTIVDAAQAEPELAMQVNGVAPGIIAEFAKQIGALLVHYSTTFVFDGTKRTPYTETDTPHPINAYGVAKLAGEQAIQAYGGEHIIIRANWVYSSRRTNFVLKMLELAQLNTEIKVVDDQIGAPTWARAYAQATAQMLKHPQRLREHCGIYNLSAAGQCTRYEWAERIIEYARQFAGSGTWPRLLRTTTAEFPLPAPRPLYTATDNRKMRERLDIELQPWDVMLREFMQNHFRQGRAATANARL